MPGRHRCESDHWVIFFPNYIRYVATQHRKSQGGLISQLGNSYCVGSILISFSYKNRNMSYKYLKPFYLTDFQYVFKPKSIILRVIKHVLFQSFRQYPFKILNFIRIWIWCFVILPTKNHI